jgi:hypothetical protein
MQRDEPIGAPAQQSLALTDDEFVAFRLEPPLLDLVPSPRRRAWMDASPGTPAIANRCLPMLIANSAGWVVLSSCSVTCVWDGRDSPEAVRVSGSGGELPVSHFGLGILTWRIPFLFRTPPGWSVLMRGPANLPKDGASSLEGIIETDWAIQPAFHSWKITRVGQPVTWESGEPVCMIVPTRLATLAAWRPRSAELLGDPGGSDLRDDYVAFSKNRARFNASFRDPGDWQQDYFRGRSPGNARAPAGSHWTSLKLRPLGEHHDPGAGEV